MKRNHLADVRFIMTVTVAFDHWATGNHGKRERERKRKRKRERERERKTGKGRQVQYWYNITCPEMAAADSDDPRGSHY